MRISLLPLFCLPAVALADSTLKASEYSSASSSRIQSIASPSLETLTAATITPTPVPITSPWRYDDLPANLKQFIIEMSPAQKVFDRQQGGVGGGAPPPAAAPTQVSPVTVYDVGAGPTTYTQTFAPTPSQWPTPGTGTVGLGTISGTVGKVRTYANPAPTNHPGRVVGWVAVGGVGVAMVL